jgi:hypothetical protein
MAGIDTAIGIVNLINAAAPGVAELILLIRKRDGTVTVAALLDEADAAFAANIKQAQDWLATHPKA